MPIIDYNVTSYTDTGRNRVGIQGGHALAERALYRKLVELWYDQTALMADLPKLQDPVDQRKFEWPLRSRSGINATPQHEITEGDEHTPFADEPFWLDNSTTTLKAVIKRGLAMQKFKHSHMSRGFLTDDAVGASAEIVRGMEQLFWSGEFNDPSNPASIRSAAGIGVNMAGTAYLPIAGPKWNQNVPVANNRMTQLDATGAVFDLDMFLNLGHQGQLKGMDTGDFYCDWANKRRLNGFISIRERVDTQPGQTNHIIEQVVTDLGLTRIHMVQKNFPSRAIFFISLDGDLIGWAPVAGLGFQLIRLARRGDYDQFMIRMEYTFAPLAPNSIAVEIDTAP